MFTETTARKQNIRNPDLWVGRYVRHMANWWDYAETEKYFVCEWSGKLFRREDEYAIGNAEEARELLARGWDICYSYSAQAAIEMPKMKKPDYSIRWIGTPWDDELYPQAA